MILRSPLSRIYYYKKKNDYKYRNPNILYQTTVEPLPQYLIELVL